MVLLAMRVILLVILAFVTIASSTTTSSTSASVSTSSLMLVVVLVVVLVLLLLFGPCGFIARLCISKNIRRAAAIVVIHWSASRFQLQRGPLSRGRGSTWLGLMPIVLSIVASAAELGTVGNVTSAETSSAATSSSMSIVVSVIVVSTSSISSITIVSNIEIYSSSGNFCLTIAQIHE